MDNILALLGFLLVGLVVAAPSVKLSIPGGARVERGDDVRITCTVKELRSGALLNIDKYNETTGDVETLVTNGQLDYDGPDKDRYSTETNKTGIEDYDFTLKITDVQVRDGGGFICLIRDGDKIPANHSITMDVHAPPNTTPRKENTAPLNSAASLIVVMATAVFMFL